MLKLKARKVNVNIQKIHELPLPASVRSVEGHYFIIAKVHEGKALIPTLSLLEHLSVVEDTRSDINQRHDLIDIIFLVISALVHFHRITNYSVTTFDSTGELRISR